MLHGDALRGVHGGLQEANIKKKRTLAPSITSIVSKFELDISILSIVYSKNKIEPLGEKELKRPPLPYQDVKIIPVQDYVFEWVEVMKISLF